MKRYLILLTLIISSAAFGQWAQGIGGTLQDKGTAVAVDAGGNVYVAGYFRGGLVDFDPSPTASYEMTADNGYGDLFFAKYASDGSFLWANQIGGTDEDVATSIAVDASGNVYLAGYFMGTNIDFDPGVGTHNLSSNGNWDVFFAKYTTDGAYVWANSIGGTGNDKATGIKLDAGGNIFIAGCFASANMDFDFGAGTTTLSTSGSLDLFFMKYTNAGVFSWAKKMGGTDADEVTSMVLDASGNIYLTGNYNGTANLNPSGTFNLTSLGSSDIFFAKYTSAGALTWAKSLGGTGQDKSNSIAVDASGNVYLTGSFSSGSIDLDPDAGTQTIWVNGWDDGFLSKYNSGGTYVWKIQLGKSLSDGGKALALDAGGNIYITGYYGSTTVDFDPSGSSFTLGLYGNTDTYLAKYTSAGALSWASGIGGSGYDEPFALAADGTYLYLTGYHNSSPFDSDPGAGTNNLAVNGDYDIVFGKYRIADGLLPVELSSFSAKAAGSAVVLQWETKTEVSNYGFDIERKSLNEGGGRWEKIGFVNGNGSSSSPKEYSFKDENPPAGKLLYRLRQTDNDGAYKYYDAVEAEAACPGGYALMQNSPNPFNPSTAIKFQIPEKARVSVRVYNLLGGEVAVLADEEKAAGSHIVYWNGKDNSGQMVSSGIYLYKLTAGQYTQTRKMSLLK